ncbi:OmpA family protein [Ascidiimonas sp. W6]|uniref:OmpA family protein n=1 Tax=Ascidiimonas meishanensis TaxID=3128903 RepID=UPI0030EBD7FA
MKLRLVLILTLFFALSHAQTYNNKNSLALQQENYAFTSLEKPLTSSGINSAPFLKALNKRPNVSLLQKANTYFKNLSYTQAAVLYEKILADQAPIYSFEILKKAANAHYLNTEMYMANIWYEELYNKHRKQMTPAMLFQYANTLKGIGKQGKAKRILRRYKKEIGNIPAKTSAGNLPLPVINHSKLILTSLSINSTSSEFSPVFLGNDKLVYAATNDDSYMDLYIANINSQTLDLEKTMPFPETINSKYHEAGVAFTPDLKTMFFTRTNFDKKLKKDKNGVSHLKIYMSTFKKGSWTRPKEVSFNSDLYSTAHPAVSPDGKKLYFISDMPGTLGDTDIFVVDILPYESFSIPRNLGPEINTSQKELFPFVTDTELYFSSEGHLGLGNLDIFQATLLKEGGFNKVQNLGTPYNSENDDFSFVINSISNKGYFASNRAGGKGEDDIYAFQTPTQSLELATTKSKHLSKEPASPILFKTIVEASKMLVDSNELSVQAKEEVIVKQDMNASITKSKTEDVVKSESYFIVENGITKLKNNGIHFGFGESSINKDAALELDKIVLVLKQHENLIIKIEAHTDARGSKVYNKILSESRAQASKAYLVANGIDTDRIVSAIGYGEEQLLNECNDTVVCAKEVHERNRRSEFIIINP